jgi:hypothetical protein
VPEAFNPLPIRDVLSQYGTTRHFRDTPLRGQPGISLVWGQLSAQAAFFVVTGRTGFSEAHLVRHTQLERLQEAGLRVWHNPTQRNPLHVTVNYDGDWDPSIAERFEGCFDDPIGGQDG